ncbi:MAG: methyltransferase domain-containing protein [Firmicutes bacterium]|nr:methyltransferase domain-containing protein [Bacillota bacterium]
MNNYTNVIKYKFLAPVYDTLIGNRIFVEARRKGFALLEFQPGESILLVGVGTGQDLPLLPDNVRVVGVDISDAMLARAGRIARGRDIKLINMNAEILEFPGETFDTVVLNLILSVVENPQKAMAEAVRVLKRSGKILVFDKFLKKDQSPAIARKLLNSITTLMGTDINRYFEDIARELPVKIIHDTPSIFAGGYRIILLEKI